MARTKPFEPEDLRFIQEFKSQLQRKYEDFSGTDQEFAQKLDVSRPALLKYLDGTTMPGLRTVVLAHKNLDLHIRYGDFDVKQIVGKGRRRARSPEAQMLLPFAIQSLRQEDVEIEIGEKKKNAIDLSVRIRFAS